MNWRWKYFSMISIQELNLEKIKISIPKHHPFPSDYIPRNEKDIIQRTEFSRCTLFIYFISTETLQSYSCKMTTTVWERIEIWSLFTEPFTLSNTAHSVHNQMVFDAIRQAFIDGCYELDGNRDLKAFLDVGPINVSVGSSVG